jgi:cytochrome P450
VITESRVARELVEHDARGAVSADKATPTINAATKKWWITGVAWTIVAVVITVWRRGVHIKGAMMERQVPTAAGTTIALEPFTGSHLSDPYPAYAALRAQSGARFAADLGVWLVSRYDDVRAVLSDPETFATTFSLMPVLPVCPHAGEVLGGLATKDPVSVGSEGPSHARTRRALMATFGSNPRKAAEYAPMVQAIVDELIEGMRGREEVDFVREFAWELTVRVILAILGVPAEDQAKVKAWGDGRLALLWGKPTDEEQVRLARAEVAWWEYCQQLTARRIAEPGDDFVSALLAYRGGDDAVLTEREVASFTMDLLSAGHETTSNMLTNGMLQLLVSGSWDKLVEDPARIPGAIEEMLRFDSPLVGWLRNTTRAATVGDVEISAGERVMVLLGSANRDERRFPNAGSFDVGRADPYDHLSFGLGRHFCPGAALARLEARLVLQTLVRRQPGLRLADGFKPRYEPNCAFRLLQSLPLAWDGTA